MKYLHESNVDTNTHADLQAVINAIDNGEGYTVSGKTYASIIQHPFREGNAIPIINTTVEDYLTASEQSALDDTSILTTPRNSDLPESKDWMIKMARMLEYYSASDYDIPQNPFPSWTNDLDGTETDDELYALYKKFFLGSINDSKEGYLVDGNGFVLNTLEDAGTIRMSMDSLVTQQLAYLAYDFDYSGNPWHIDNNPTYAKALMRRHLCCSCIELIMRYDGENTDHYRWQFYNYLGYTLRACKDVMVPTMIDVYRQAMQDCYYDYLESNHYGLQSTLDQTQRTGVMFLALENDPSLRKQWLDTFEEKSTYNFRYGKINDHTLDHDGGIDLAYQGRTEKFVMECYPFLVKHAPDYATHMKAWIDRFMKFRVYQVFPEPDGEDRTWFGPTGINVGTGESHIDEQDPSIIKWTSLAYHSPTDGLFMAWKYGNETILRTRAQIETFIQDQINGYSQYRFVEEEVHGGSFASWWYGSTPFDMDLGKVIDMGDEYSFLSSKKNNLSLDYYENIDNDEIKPAFLRSTDFIVEDFGTFLPAKFNSGTSDEWGCQIYTCDLGFRGDTHSPTGETEVAGFHGGVSGIWHKNLGTVLISRIRGQQSDNNNDRLDHTPSAGYYTGWYTWCDNHLGGKLTSGEPFTTGYFGRTYNTNDLTVNGTTDFSISVADNLTPMRDGYDPLSGQVDFTMDFEGDSTGLTVTKTLTADATAQNQDIDELYEFLPLVELGPDMGSSFDKTIEISTDGGSTYILPSLGAYNDNVNVIRINRDSNSVYIVLDSTEHPNGLDMYFPTDYFLAGGEFSKHGNIRIVRLDLLGNSGTAQAFPASTTVKWKFQMTAP